MARKPIAEVGQRVIVEGIVNALEVLEVAQAKDAFPFLNDKRSKASARNRNGFAYRLKMKTVKPKWFMEYEIVYVVRYAPVSISVERHAELCDSLGGYEVLRDFIAGLPQQGRTGRMAAELAKLVEACALSVEGDYEERYEAESTISSLMQ